MPRAVGRGCARRSRGSGPRGAARGPARAELPDLDVALGGASRRAGSLASGPPDTAAGRGHGQEADGHRRLHQPAHRPRRRGRPGAAGRHRRAFHPTAGGTAELTVPVTLPGGYFDAMYEAAADPWGFQDRWYEQRKYALKVRVEQRQLPGQWPAGDFDLIVLSELLYYFADRGLARLARHCEPDFLAEVYIRTDTTPVSVAQATGL